MPSKEIFRMSYHIFFYSYCRNLLVEKCWDSKTGKTGLYNYIP